MVGCCGGGGWRCEESGGKAESLIRPNRIHFKVYLNMKVRLKIPSQTGLGYLGLFWFSLVNQHAKQNR
jgi:hypothetical protein